MCHQRGFDILLQMRIDRDAEPGAALRAVLAEVAQHLLARRRRRPEHVRLVVRDHRVVRVGREIVHDEPLCTRLAHVGLRVLLVERAQVP